MVVVIGAGDDLVYVHAKFITGLGQRIHVGERGGEFLLLLRNGLFNNGRGLGAQNLRRRVCVYVCVAPHTTSYQLFNQRIARCSDFQEALQTGKVEVLDGSPHLLMANQGVHQTRIPIRTSEACSVATVATSTSSPGTLELASCPIA